MATAIQPLADYILAEQEEASNKTASGLYLPDKAQEKPKMAKVLSVGKLVKEIKTGDKIIYGGYSTTEVKHAGKDYLLVKEENVYAIVK